MSDLTKFLLARVAEDEAVARAAATDPRHSWVFVDWGGNANADHGQRWAPARVLAECEAKRRIIALHESWPVLVETPLEITADPVDISGMTFRAAKQIAWLTEKEYRARFGDEPPTAPILAALALPYADHPDYREEWRP